MQFMTPFKWVNFGTSLIPLGLDVIVGKFYEITSPGIFILMVEQPFLKSKSVRQAINDFGFEYYNSIPKFKVSYTPTQTAKLKIPQHAMGSLKNID